MKLFVRAVTVFWLIGITSAMAKGPNYEAAAPALGFRPGTTEPLTTPQENRAAIEDAQHPTQPPAPIEQYYQNPNFRQPSVVVPPIAPFNPNPIYAPSVPTRPPIGYQPVVPTTPSVGKP